MDEDHARDMQTVSTIKKFRHRKKQLYQSIQQQMEFYFSDANLSKDRFLGQLIQNDKYVDLLIFLRFNKIRCLTTNIQDIVKALRNSELLSISEDGTRVCRKTPIKVKENEEECTIYVEQLPPDAQHDWLKGIFSQYGNVAYVSIPKYKNGKIKGFAFVEFDTPKAASKTLEAFGAMGCCLPTQMPPEQLCSITTFDSENLEAMERQSGVGGEMKEDMEIDQPKSDQRKSGNTGKKKKKKDKENATKYEETMNIQLKEDIDTEVNRTETDEEKGDLADKKIMDKLVEGNVEHQSESHPPDTEHLSVLTKKRKRKKGSAEDLNLDNPCSLQVEDTYQCPPKRRKETVVSSDEISNNDNEIVLLNENEEMEDVELEGDEEDDNEVFRRKKNRKHKSKSKREKQELDNSKFGLQILSKREWKRLRNKYLDLQKKKMRALKQQLLRARWGSNYQQQLWKDSRKHANRNGEHGKEEMTGDINAAKPSPRTTFTPGVIIHVHLDEIVSDSKKFKSEAKLYPDIKYIDVQENANEAYVRCSTCEAAEKLVAENPWQNMSILKGEEETKYWEKIKKDREEKLGKKIRVKKRGRTELLKKAEKELGKHIRFDE